MLSVRVVILIPFMIRRGSSVLASSEKDESCFEDTFSDTHLFLDEAHALIF